MSSERGAAAPARVGLALLLGATIAAPAAAQPADAPPLSEEERALLDQALAGETIEVWDQRPTRPFDRDTELRLTGAELQRRGVSNLAEALDLLPETRVRDVSRGGRQVEIRGARKGSVKILLDGVPVGDAYRGNFDVSAIPVTDIVELRVSASPASPIDGTGGPGGVVEISTRDAIGGRLLAVRMEASTQPQALSSVSGRAMLGRDWAARVSVTGDLGGRDLRVVMPTGDEASIDEDRQAVSGAVRLEHRRGARRVVTDLALRTGGYLVPPSETETSQIVDVRAANEGRLGVAADDAFGEYRVLARAYAGFTTLKTRFYPDALRERSTREDVAASSLGGGVVANRPIGASLQLVASASVDSEQGEVEGAMRATGGRATIAALAAGFKLDRGALRVDGAVGGAVPIGIGARPWPEGKLAVKAAPVAPATARVVVGYKGRLPTLRERFDATGNEALGPEKALYGEAGVALDRNPYLALDVAGWVRRMNGMIRISPDTGRLTNVGALTMRGLDARVTALPTAPVRVGASIGLLEASSGDFGEDVVDRLPQRRGDAWVAADLGRHGGATARLTYVGEMVDQNVTLDDYWLVEASAFYNVTSAIMAGVRIDNALDERYLVRYFGVVGTGRVVLISAQGTFE